MSDYIPSLPAICREAICVAAGALLVAAVVRALPPNVQNLFMINRSQQ